MLIVKFFQPNQLLFLFEREINCYCCRLSCYVLPKQALLHFGFLFCHFVDIIIYGLLCLSFGIEKENLCLYGHPEENWEVTLPAEEVPPELPEPALGINFARDGMNRRDWLSLVAVHSDCWLLSVAFYLGARLNRNERCTFFVFCF